MIAKSAWTEDFIKGIIQKCHTVEGAVEKTDERPNSYFLWRMLVAIYDRQVADEKASEHTKHHNKKGFTPGDAKILSNVAKQSLKYKNLTPKQCAKIVAPRMLKYAAQLARVIKEKDAAASTPVVKPSTKVVTKVIKPAPEDDADYCQHGLLLCPECDPEATHQISEEQYHKDYAKHEAEMEAAAYLHKMPIM